MAATAFIVLCAQALLIQSAVSQCTSRAAIDASGFGAPYGWGGPAVAPAMAAPGLAYDGVAAGWAGRGIGCEGLYAPAMEFTATSGGALPVTSASAIAPTGISVVSENVFEGALSVAGELPFVGTTGMEGAVPTTGAGAINHACGDGVTAMISEATIAPGSGFIAAANFAPAPAMATAALGPAAGFGPAGFAPSVGFGPAGLGPATGFGPAAGFGPAGLGPAGRLGIGGCNRGIMY